MTRRSPTTARLRLATVLVAVAVAAAAAAPTASAAEPPTAAQLERRALEKMQQGAYEDAADLLLAALEAQPERTPARYNLACCYSRLGRIDDAVIALEVAWRDGFRNLDLVRADPDLEALRSSRPGRELVARLEAEHARFLRRAGEPFQIEAPVLAGVRVIPPTEVEDGELVPLVVLLHGYGGTADVFAGLFEAAGMSPPYVVCAVFGPYPMPGGATPGGSWFPPISWYRPDALAGGADLPEDVVARELEVTRRFVWRAVDAVLERYPADPERIVVAGFSQGGVLAYELALDHPDRVWGTVAIGARMMERSRNPERLAAAAGGRFLLLHSPDDASIGIDSARTALGLLKDAGADVELKTYAGGHGITVEAMNAVRDWIDAGLKAERGEARGDRKGGDRGRRAEAGDR